MAWNFQLRDWNYFRNWNGLYWLFDLYICIHIYIYFFYISFSIRFTLFWALRDFARILEILSVLLRQFVLYRARHGRKSSDGFHRFFEYIASHAYAGENILLRQRQNADAADNKRLLNQHVPPIASAITVSQSARMIPSVSMTRGWRFAFSTIFISSTKRQC